jgi:iron(II)-dependent oxidoreductase
MTREQTGGIGNCSLLPREDRDRVLPGRASLQCAPTPAPLASNSRGLASLAGSSGRLTPLALALTLAVSLACAGLGATGCSDDDSQGNDNNNNAPGICGAGWIHIPEGPFVMGIDADDPRFEPYNMPSGISPKHTVQLSAYCIERTEVSVSDYRACVQAGACEVPDQTHANPPCNYTLEPGELERHPINCVTWEQARTYCQQWAGGDLPSEAQWEKAARGTEDDDRLWPWGDAPRSCERANYDENGPYDEDTGEGFGVGCFHRESPYTWEVGYLETSKGDSPYGLKDMSGNVEEWVLDCEDAEFYAECAAGPCVDPVNMEVEGHCTRVARGGSAMTGGSVVDRGGGSFSEPITGLRCTKPVPKRSN